MLSVSKCLKSWNVSEESISVVLLSDGTKGVRWVWYDGGGSLKFILNLKKQHKS